MSYSLAREETPAKCGRKVLSFEGPDINQGTYTKRSLTIEFFTTKKGFKTDQIPDKDKKRERGARENLEEILVFNK